MSPSIKTVHHGLWHRCSGASYAADAAPNRHQAFKA